MPAVIPSKISSLQERAAKWTNGRLFRWGIWFWSLLWITSILVYLTLTVTLKGCWGTQLYFGGGSFMIDCDTYSTGDWYYFHAEDPIFLWSEPMTRDFTQNPEDLVCLLGRVGWQHQGTQYTFAIPIGGILWFWLIAKWVNEFRQNRIISEKDSPTTGVRCTRRRPFARAMILSVLPALIMFADYKARRAHEAAYCSLCVRNIQMSVRGYSGVKNLNIGDRIPWEDIFGPGKSLSADAKTCPGGGDYRLTVGVTDIGVLAAECPNPEHRRRLHSANDTSEW